MLLKKSAMAGTLESSDVQVTISPNKNGIDI
jgi:citrate lyase gamma subunit